MSDHLPPIDPEQVLIQELENLKDAKRLLAYITQATERLNKVLRALPDEAIRKNGLYWGYSLSSIGNPRIGDPPQAIVLANQERKERVIWHSSALNPFDREHARSVLRKGKMPEPMIWERWPAINDEEKADKASRIAAFAAKNRPKDYIPQGPVLSDLDQFLNRQAQTEARRHKTTPQALLENEAWKASQVIFYEETKDIVLTF